MSWIWILVIVLALGIAIPLWVMVQMALVGDRTRGEIHGNGSQSKEIKR